MATPSKSNPSSTASKSKSKAKASSTRSKKARSKGQPRQAGPRPVAAKRPETAVGRVASVLPGALREAKYIKRTIEILDTREKKRERLEAQTKKQLFSVVKDLRGDVTERIEAERDAAKKRVDDTVEKVKKTKVAKTIDAVPKRVTKAIDRWLARVGLQRKAS